MSTPEEPARLVSESSGASAELRRALGAARSDLPSPDQVEAMLARFPFPDGGGGGDTGGGGDAGGGGADVGAGAEIAASAATKSAAIGKWLGIAFVAASAGVAFYANTTVAPDPVQPIASASAEATASAVTAAVTMKTPPPSATESSTPTTSASAPSTPHLQPSVTASATESSASASSASASSSPARSEIEILKDAHAARSNPARMLELVNEHARLYPRGMLGQEREILRIEALVGLGKRAEAKALADAFRKGNPSSVYSERLNQIVPP